MNITTDKFLILVSGVVIYLSFFLSALLKFGAINQIDTLVFIALIFKSLFYFIFTGKIPRTGAIFFISILSFFIISSLGQNTTSLFISILSSILFVKIFLVFYALDNVKLKNLTELIHVISLLHIIGILLNIIVPDYFVALFPSTRYELDPTRIGGFLINPNLSASVSMTLALYNRFILQNNKLFVLFCFFIFLSASVSFFTIFILLLTYFSIISDKNIKSITLTLFLLITFYLFFEESIQQRFSALDITLNSAGQYIRVGMLLGGYKLANDNFPFGSGGGTFGSSLSSNTSISYSQAGLSNWNSIVDSTGVFDSGIGSLIGEYGYLGLITFIFLLLVMFKNFSSNALRFNDYLFFVFLVIFLSFFRSVSSDFFYSIIILLNFLILIHLREQNKFHESHISS